MKRVSYRSYLTMVLLTVLAFNGADRLALALLIEGMSVDLDLSDTRFGVLSGIAFSVFYSIAGIPIARWADRGNRVVIIATTTALLGVALVLCGFAGNFFQLLLIRIGVAIGKAGCVPPAQSLLADYFGRSERPRAVATYMLGGPLSAVFGYSFAGWVNELWGWRTACVLLGLPGVALAVLILLTLQEPRLVSTIQKPSVHTVVRSEAGQLVARADVRSLRKVWMILWANDTFRRLLFSYTVLFFLGQGIGQWQPVFFMRSYGLETGELGAWFAAMWGLGGFLGTYLGGEFASRHAADNERFSLRAAAVVYGIFGVVSVCMYMSSNFYVAIGLMGLGIFGVSMATGPLFSTILAVVEGPMRAISIAILYLFGSLIGAGLGPLVAGALSDALRPHLGEESLRYALLILSPGYLWGAWSLWQSGKTVVRDMQVAQRAERRLA